MDSSLEEEIAKLTEPHKNNIGGAAASGPTTLPRAHATAAAPSQGGGTRLAAGGESAVSGGAASGVGGMMSNSATNSSHRRSSGSGDFSRTGSNGQLRTNPGRASPQRAAAVLAGQTISDLQAPVVPPAPATAQEVQQYQQQQQQKQRGAPMHARNSSGSRGSGRIAANGEKVAGFAPTTEAAAAAPTAAIARTTSAGSDAAMGGRKSGSLEVGKDEELWRRSEEALKKKEESVRNALRQKKRTLQQETMLLATVDRELAQLALAHQTEINELRKTLEVVDRELAFMDKDAQRKLEAFEKARTVLSAKVTEKQGITTRLTQLIMASEKQKDEKLNEIMKKMSTEAGIDAGGASPNATPSEERPGGVHARQGSGSGGPR